MTSSSRATTAELRALGTRIVMPAVERCREWLARTLARWMQHDLALVTEQQDRRTSTAPPWHAELVAAQNVGQRAGVIEILQAEQDVVTGKRAGCEDPRDCRSAFLWALAPKRAINVCPLEKG